MNSIPRVVFPVPAVPSTSTTLPRRRPPAMMSSSPTMPVFTRSRSGMVNALGPGSSARVAVRDTPVRPSLPQQRSQRAPSIRRRAHLPQRFQPFLGIVDFEDIHSPGSAVVERPFQETGAEQQVERPRDLHEIVADEGRELLTAEDDARMPREEEEQVEVARIPQTSRFNEPFGQGVGRLKILDAAAPFPGTIQERYERRISCGSQQ